MDKVYVYEYDLEIITGKGNFKKEHRINLFNDVKELMESVKSNENKYYISGEKVYTFDNKKEIELDRVLNPF